MHEQCPALSLYRGRVGNTSKGGQNRAQASRRKSRGSACAWLFPWSQATTRSPQSPLSTTYLKAVGFNGHTTKCDCNQFCSQGANQRAVFFNFPTVLRIVQPSQTADNNSLLGVRTLVNIDLDKQGNLQFKGENVFKVVSTTRMKSCTWGEMGSGGERLNLL